MLLYSFHLSSASYRVRIVLNLKGIEYDVRDINLVNNEHKNQNYRSLNAQCLVPTLVDGTIVLSQSTAIIEYLEETFPSIPLLPMDPEDRSRIRALCQFIACEMQPLTNARVRRYLALDSSDRVHEDSEWTKHWTMKGLHTLENMLSVDIKTKKFCHGDQPTIADAYLVLQMTLARRFVSPLSQFETLCRIEKNCLAMPQFRNETYPSAAAP